MAHFQSESSMPVLENERHELFAQNCAKGMSEFEAYKSAGLGGKNESSTRGSASRLRSNAHITARIRELQKEAAKQAVAEIKDEIVTTQMVLKGLLEIAQVDFAEAYDENSNLKPIKDIPPAIRRAMSSIEVEELFQGRGNSAERIGYLKKVKFWDKTKSYELLGKHLKLFSEKFEVHHKVTLEDLVAGSHEPEKK